MDKCERRELAARIYAHMFMLVVKARARTLTPEDLEVWNSPACEAYTGLADRNCVECPLEGAVCGAIQTAYKAFYRDEDPTPYLESAKRLLRPALRALMQSEREEVPG